MQADGQSEETTPCLVLQCPAATSRLQQQQQQQQQVRPIDYSRWDHLSAYSDESEDVFSGDDEVTEEEEEKSEEEATELGEDERCLEKGGISFEEERHLGEQEPANHDWLEEEEAHDDAAAAGQADGPPQGEANGMNSAEVAFR